MRNQSWFNDSNTPGLKAKLPEVAFCEIREVVVAPETAALTNQNTMPFLCTETKVPYRNDFEPTEKGYTAYYA